MNQQEYEEMFKETLPEAATPEQGVKENHAGKPSNNDNTEQIANAISVVASMAIFHSQAYDILWHLMKIADILKGVE